MEPALPETPNTVGPIIGVEVEVEVEDGDNASCCDSKACLAMDKVEVVEGVDAKPMSTAAVCAPVVAVTATACPVLALGGEIVAENVPDESVCP